MILLDANYILRYLLRDNESMFEEAKDDIIDVDMPFKVSEVMS